MAEVARGSCLAIRLAIRSALTDDGRPPLAASGLKLKKRLAAVADSLDRVQYAQEAEASATGNNGQQRATTGKGAEPAARPVAASAATRLGHALDTTAPLWPPIQTAYAFVPHAAHRLAHHDDLDGAALRQAYQEQVLAPLRTHQADLGSLAPAATHFARVTASYWPGLFHCYDVPHLPRANNDLEQYVGAARQAERRATGRKSASPALVVRGAVRVVALMATRQQVSSPAELQPRDLATWRAFRQRLDARHQTRRAQARFRRDPIAYLTTLERQLLKPALPP